MSILRLAANRIAYTKFGHLQIVKVKDDGSQIEMEVQRSAAGNWRYSEEDQDHSETPFYEPAGNRNYAFKDLILPERTADDAWAILEQVHDQFANGGYDIDYDFKHQNSNSFVTTALSVIGVNTLGQYIKPSNVSSFPGERTNVLDNPDTAIPLKIEGSDGYDVIRTGAASDRLYGFGGDDRLVGGAGDDIISGGFGFDRIDGGRGFDTADYSHTNANDLIINLSTGSVTQGSATGVETLKSIEQVVGGGGSDTIIGSKRSDFISGQSGIDLITGGGAADHLRGGPGNDIFIYDKLSESRSLAAADMIYDFEDVGVVRADRIDLSSIPIFGDDKEFVFIGAVAPSGRSGTGKLWTQDHYQAGRGYVTLVNASTDADKHAELVVKVDDGASSAQDWVADDFIV